MPGDWKVIKPKKDPFAKRLGGAAGRVALALRNFGADSLSDISNYPTAQTDYVRTGTLGQRWTMDGPKVQANEMRVKIGNKTIYAKKVQGKKGQQSKIFKGYGWSNVTDVAQTNWVKHRPLLMAAIRG